MWLRCDHCAEERLLSKYYPKLTDGWFLPVPFVGALRHPDSAQWVANMEAFLEKHSFCPTGARTMHGNTAFSLRFEEP
jgi:hypothetical protein